MSAYVLALICGGAVAVAFVVGWMRIRSQKKEELVEHVAGKTTSQTLDEIAAYFDDEADEIVVCAGEDERWGRLRVA